MRSLDAHFRTPGGHGHLPFNAGCPKCCAERLGGPLPNDEVIGSRPRALLAVAVLAGATATPAVPVIAPEVAFAQDESDDEGAGGAEDPERKQFDDEGGSGGFEDAPEVAVPEPAGGSPPATPPSPDTAAPSPPPAAAPSPPEAPATQSPPAPAPSPLPGSGPSPREEPSEPGGKPDSQRDRGDRLEPPTPGPPQRGRTPSAPSGQGVAPTATPMPSQPGGGPTSSAAPSSPAPPPAGEARELQQANSEATHRVRPGESLWSIAQQRLGAGASPGQVARLVNWLWELNAGRIATGDPDLIMVGTLLRLR